MAGQAPPRVNISVTVEKPKFENPNAHLFSIKKHPENRFDYHKIRQTNTSRQPVLFEYVSDIHLTRSKYIITSFLSFDQYYKGFDELEQYASNLLSEITNLASSELPYFLRRGGDSETALLNVIASLRKEVINLVVMLENHKQQFNKIIDHMTTTTDSKTHKRSKRSLLFGIIGWLIGRSGSNDATIEQIKKNLEILEDNQNTLASEITRQLEMINNTNFQISQNRAVLNTLTRDFIQLNHTMTGVITNLKIAQFSRNFIYAMLQIRNKLALMRDGMDNLRQDLSKIHEYMTSLTSHKVTPNLIPPSDLREILSDVEEKLKANPKLALPQTEEKKIWSYYQFLKLDAFVHQEMLIVILILPLIDKDLQFDLFRAHNLPLLHPQLKKVFTYSLESTYIAIRSDGNYLTLPLHDDILMCTISAGHFCRLNTPLYPVKDTKLCVFHLLMNNEDKITDNCKLNVDDYTHDIAINLEHNTWALVVLKPTELHVTCLSYSYTIKIESNFQLVELDNSCQAYNPNLILPSSNTQESEGGMITRRFFNYNLNYTSIPNFFLMETLQIDKLTPEQLDNLTNELPPVQNIPFEDISKKLKPINRHYPFVFPAYGKILITIVVTTLVILIIGIACYLKYKRAKARQITGHLPMFKREKRAPPSKDDIELQPMSLNTTNESVRHELAQPSTSGRKTPVTPLLIQRKLEHDFGIDFSTYDRKQSKSKKRSDQMNSIV